MFKHKKKVFFFNYQHGFSYFYKCMRFKIQLGIKERKGGRGRQQTTKQTITITTKRLN